ncbi:hypothetical protein F5X99DRAFT_410534 [Biscogniauxia marginata]|nr:hypothetical protein F5X99DRAFT_410534 [Biscogniauxia marginata]
MDQANPGWAPGPYDQSGIGMQPNIDGGAGGLEYNQQYDDPSVPQGGYYNEPSFYPFDSNQHAFRAVHPNEQPGHNDLTGSSIPGNVHYTGVDHPPAATTYYNHPYPARLGDGGQVGGDQHGHGGQHQTQQFVHDSAQGNMYGQQILSQQNQAPHQLPGPYASSWAEAHPHQNSPSPYGQPRPTYGTPIPQQQHWQQHMHAPSPVHTPTPPPTKRNTPVTIDPSTSPLYTPGIIDSESLSRQPPINPQPSQYVPQQGFAPGRQDSASPSYGSIAMSSSQPVSAFHQQAYQHQPSMQLPQHMSAGRSPASVLPRQPSSGNGQGSLLPQYPIQQTNNAQIPTPSGVHASPVVSSTSDPADTQMQRVESGVNLSAAVPLKRSTLGVAPDSQAAPEQGWLAVEGCANLVVGTTPGRRRPARKERRSEYVARHNASGTLLLPDRAGQLPCEMQREFHELNQQVNYGTITELDRQRLVTDMQKLDKEMVKLTGRNGVLKADPGTTQPRKGRNRKSSQADSSADSTEASSSEDESDLDREARRIMSAPARPTDPVKGVEYDVVKIVFRDPHNPRKDQEIIHAFGEYVSKLWAEVKELRKKIEVAQEKNRKDSQISLQEDLTRRYTWICTAVETAIKFCDAFLIRNMGGNEKLVVILFNALRAQFASKDYNGPFAKAILHFMSIIKPREKNYLTERLKMDKVRNKHFNDLDDEGKRYMDQIFANAKANNADQPSAKQPDVSNDAKKEQLNAPKKTATTVTKTTGSIIKAPGPKTGALLKKSAPEIKKIQPTDYSGLGSARKVSNGATKANASPSKRPRDDDAESRAPKKVAVEGVTGAPATTKNPSVSATSSTAAPNSTAANSQVRPRPSGPMLLGKSRLPAKTPVKRSEPQQSATSTISGLLAEIAKPAEKPKPREEPAKAPETPEEKARRLRKEARRGLRVMWKPDDELAEYRIFEHDSNEDEGRASNMVRDARDNRSEGQMLKMQRTIQEDDEEEDGRPKEVELRSWVEPSAIDFNALDANQREKSFVTRGGLREVQSEQKKAMEEYENRELMAIYTTLSEIPETPRSPPNKTTDTFTQPKTALLPSDNPKFQEIHRRWAEVRQFGTAGALQLGLQRLGISSPKPTSQSAHAVGDTSSSFGSMSGSASSRPRNMPRIMTQEERDAEVLALLKSDKVKNYTDPDSYDPADLDTPQRREYSDPKVQQAANAIEAVVAELKDLPFPPTEPPKWLQSNPERVQEWHTGRNNDMANKAKKEANERAIRLAEEYARQMAGVQIAQAAAQSPAYAPYQLQAQPQVQQQHQYHQPYPQASPQVPDQYAAILQQVQALQGNQAAQHTPPQPPPVPAQPDTTNLHNLLAALGQSTQAAQVPQAPSQTQAPDYGYWQAWAQNQAQSYGTQYDGVSYEGPPPFGSQPQRSQQTQSQNGQHSRDNSDRGNRKEFNRGNKDHKGINRSLIGTKPCTFWAKGQCAKGDQCTFRHDPNDLK